jgi:hypothetical protein
MTSAVKCSEPPPQPPRDDPDFSAEAGFGVGVFGFKTGSLLAVVGIEERCSADDGAVLVQERSRGQEPRPEGGEVRAMGIAGLFPLPLLAGMV